ncbi:hypothetical protein, partial [Massilia sp. CCM 8734]|uniref:hypothetical protein n=1 Tax=Massilia sp. CCM 8734 TaxID=2609283 RepID=UPI001AAF453A
QAADARLCQQELDVPVVLVGGTLALAHRGGGAVAIDGRDFARTLRLVAVLNAAVGRCVL